MAFAVRVAGPKGEVGYVLAFQPGNRLTGVMTRRCILVTRRRTDKRDLRVLK